MPSSGRSRTRDPADIATGSAEGRCPTGPLCQNSAPSNKGTCAEVITRSARRGAAGLLRQLSRSRIELVAECHSPFPGSLARDTRAGMDSLGGRGCQDLRRVSGLRPPTLERRMARRVRLRRVYADQSTPTVRYADCGPLRAGRQPHHPIILTTSRPSIGTPVSVCPRRIPAVSPTWNPVCPVSK